MMYSILVRVEVDKVCFRKLICEQKLNTGCKRPLLQTEGACIATRSRYIKLYIAINNTSKDL